ncbi:hypothetical protein LINGRAHAP2_LOCUS26057 [Linum grandiflorum]
MANRAQGAASKSMAAIAAAVFFVVFTLASSSYGAMAQDIAPTPAMITGAAVNVASSPLAALLTFICSSILLLPLLISN